MLHAQVTLARLRQHIYFYARVHTLVQDKVLLATACCEVDKKKAALGPRVRRRLCRSAQQRGSEKGLELTAISAQTWTVLAFSVMIALDSQGKYQEADELYLRAIGMQEKALGSNHPDLAASLGSRALLFQSQVTIIFLSGGVSICKNSGNGLKSSVLPHRTVAE